MDSGLRTPLPVPIVSPLSGEVLPDNLPTLVSEELRVDTYLRRQSEHYAHRARLRERIAELRGPAQLPRPRYRTDVQNRVSRCSRCGSKT